MAQLDRIEMPMVDARDFGDVQPLGNGEHTGVDRSEGECGVLFDQIGGAFQVCQFGLK